MDGWIEDGWIEEEDGWIEEEDGGKEGGRG